MFMGSPLEMLFLVGCSKKNFFFLNAALGEFLIQGDGFV